MTSFGYDRFIDTSYCNCNAGIITFIIKLPNIANLKEWLKQFELRNVILNVLDKIEQN